MKRSTGKAATRKTRAGAAAAEKEVSRGRLTIREAIRQLRRYHGSPPAPPTGDAFELILWENVVYLAPPARRREAFEKLKRGVGTSPASLLAASEAALAAVTAGGILKSRFAGKLRECARIALEEIGGELNAILDGPIGPARKALRAFPGIGEPGAEKILLFSGRHALLAPDSNALRVLARLGLIQEEKSYARTYAAGRRVAEELPQTTGAMQAAHLLLQLHGQTLCRRQSPLCPACPLQRRCAHALLGEDRQRSRER